MNEYDRALELETESLNSAGSALEKYAIYTESTEAKINKMKTAFTELADATLKSGFVETFISIVTTLTEIGTLAGGLLPLIMALTGVFIAFKIGLFKAATAAIALNSALGVISLALMAIAVVWGVVSTIINANKQALEDKIKAVEKDIAKTEEQIDSIKKLKDEYISLMAIENKTEVETNKLAEVKKKLIDVYGDEANALDLVNGKYGEQTKLLREKQAADLDRLKRDLALQASLSKDQVVKEQEEIGKDFAKWSGRLKVADLLNNAEDDPIKRYELMLDEFNKLNERQLNGEDLGKEQGYFDNLKIELEQGQEAYKKYTTAVKEQEKIEKELAAIKNIGELRDNFALESAKFLNMSLEEQAKNIPKIEKAMNALMSNPELYEKYKAEIDGVTEAVREQLEVVKKTDFALLGMEAQIKALEKEKTLRDEELKQQEKLLAIEKAREELAKAKDKRVRVFRAGKGFVLEDDFAGIENAQKELDNAIKDSQGSDIDQAINGVKKLEDIYNRVISEGTMGKEKKVEDKTMREWFLDEEFRKKFENMKFEDKQKFIEQFLQLGDWKKTEDSLKEERLDNLDKWLPQHAKGTNNAEGGLSIVGEKGAEMRVLNSGDKIIPNGLTNTLIKMAKNPSEYLKSNTTNAQKSTTFNISNINFPNPQSNLKQIFDEISKIGTPTRSLV